ncbi:MAG: thiamine-phosphate kinase [Robiginitomaculum sp.]|nr:MAG: thiamine-phosphate kinase [Robiginitomaculum sp.]
MTPVRGEFAFIEALAKQAARTPEALGLTDDGAVLWIDGGRKLVMAADMLQAGVHTMPNASPAQIASKALRTNLSDLAAMGAKPAFYLSTISWPGAPSDDDMQSLVQALAQDQERFGIALVGGDTICGQGPFTISITVLGWAEGPLLRRTGAQKEDDIWVSGTIGDGYLGLAVAQGRACGLSNARQEHVLSRYEYPEPRLTLGQALARIAHCGLDVSDGLIADAEHLAKAGQCALVLDPLRVPLSEAGRQWIKAQTDTHGARETLMGGGDDYELLFCAPRQDREKIIALSHSLDVSLTRIGKVIVGEGVHLHKGDGIRKVAGRSGFTHF